jgi:RHS repeat-associated protein
MNIRLIFILFIVSQLSVKCDNCPIVTGLEYKLGRDYTKTRYGFKDYKYTDKVNSGDPNQRVKWFLWETLNQDLRPYSNSPKDLTSLGSFTVNSDYTRNVSITAWVRNTTPLGGNTYWYQLRLLDKSGEGSTYTVLRDWSGELTPQAESQTLTFNDILHKTTDVVGPYQGAAVVATGLSPNPTGPGSVHGDIVQAGILNVGMRVQKFSFTSSGANPEVNVVTGIFNANYTSIQSSDETHIVYNDFQGGKAADILSTRGELSVPYTDEKFYELTEQALNAVTPTLATTSSYYHLNTDGSVLELRSVPFVLTVRGEPGVEYTVEWLEKFIPDAGVSAQQALKRSTNFVGTGEDLRITNTLTPPTANGIKIVELITPMCGTCTPGEEQVDVHSIDISIPLGALNQTRSAGRLVVSKGDPATGVDISEVYAPAILKYGPYPNESEGGVYFYKMNGAIVKFRAPQIVGDVWKHDDNRGFTVLCYHYGQQPNVTIPVPVPSDLSQIMSTNASAVPFLIYYFRNPDTDPNTTPKNKLLLEVTRDKGTVNETKRSYVYTYENTPNSKWTLVGDGLKKQIHSRVKSLVAAGEKTVETISIEEPSNATVVEKTVLEKMKYADSGETVLTKKIENPDGKKPDGTASPLQPQTTTFVYWGPESNPTKPSSSPLFGKLALTIYPGGTWVSNVYNETSGRLEGVVSQYLNSTVDHPEQSRVTEYSYSSLDESVDDRFTDQASPRTVTHKIQNTEVAREYYVYGKTYKKEIRCQTAEAAIGAGDNLVTRTYLKTDSPFLGKPVKVVNHDGTAEFTTWTPLTGGAYQRTIASGEPIVDSSGDPIAIKNGIQTKTTISAFGTVTEESSYEILNTVVSTTLLSHQKVPDGQMDQFQRPLKTDYLDGTSTYQTYDCCGQARFTDKDGTTTITTFDSLKRRSSEVVEGIGVKRINVMDAAGNVTAVKRSDFTGSASSLKTIQSTQYDLSGRAYSSADAVGNPTSKQEAYANGKRILTTVLPNQGTIIETFNGDGTLERRTGTAAFPARFDYGVVSASGDGDYRKTYVIETKLNGLGTDTGEWVKTFYDALGRVCKVLYADGAASTMVYSSKGQLFKSIDPDLVTTVAYYDAQGRANYTGLAADPAVISTTPNPAVDRLQKSVFSYGSKAGKTTQKTETRVFKAANATETLIAVTERSVDGLVQWDQRITSAGSAEVKTEISYPQTFQKLVKTTQPAGDYITELYELGRLKERKTFDSATPAVQLTSETFGYDAYGRQTTRVDLRNGTTTYYYDDADRLNSTISPIPSTGKPALVSTNILDSMGQVYIAILPDGTRQTNEYHPTGLLKKSTGSQRYPVEYAYTAQGRLETMTTWKDYPNGSAVTTWTYHAQRGWLSGKIYSGGAAGPSYTYKASGRLLTKVSPRSIGVSVTKTYAYKPIGDLLTITYSDGTTPNLAFDYDRLGHVNSITDAAGARAVTSDDLGQFVSEPFGSYQFTIARDSLLREKKRSVMQGATPVHVQALTYLGTSSRLDKVENSDTAPTITMQYSYTPNSDLVSGISFKQNGVQKMFTSKTYDFVNRPLVIDSGTTISKTTLSYNAAGLIDRRTERDDSYWQYTYNAQGEVQSAKRYWSDGSIVAGQQYSYDFDNIGNRISSGEGGNEAGGGLAYTGYEHNALNQISVRRNPGVATVIGEANATATITVNQTRTARKGTYFFGSAPANNTASGGQSGAIYQQLDILGVRYDSTQQKDLETAPPVTKRKYVPPAAEQISHDLSGNLMSDGQWDYTWDGEDRLTSMTAKAVPGNSGAINHTLRKKLVFNYDYMNRRTRKRVYPCNSSGVFSASPELDISFIYDRWLLVAEVEATGVARKHFWGLDLSGGFFGTGGVGGLIATSDSTGTFFPAYSHNGNISAMMKASDMTVTASYEYSPFGTIVAAAGTDHTRFRFRCSTKYQDAETDFFYYGHRYYHPVTGRWLSREKMGEQESSNLYGFVSNMPINSFDVLGLYGEAGHYYTVYSVAIAAGNSQSTALELAYYAQLPDEFLPLDAKTAYLAAHNDPWLKRKFLRSDKGTDIIGNYINGTEATVNGFGRDVQELIHSLHGLSGEALEKRRGCLAKMIKDPLLKTWQRGFLLHAFGDSFAHVDPSGKAYSYPDGHGNDSIADAVPLGKDYTDPDVIGNYPARYRQYTSDLYSVLETANANPGLLHILTDSQLMRIKGTENANFADRIAHAVAVGGFNYPKNGYRPEKGHIMLPDKYPTPSGAEVAAFLQMVKAGCCVAR